MAQTIKLKRSATQGATPATSALALGEVAINTYDGKMFIKKDDGTESIVEVGASSGIANVVEDTTPQLGGDLDLNSNDITGTGNINITGNLSTDSKILLASAHTKQKIEVYGGGDEWIGTSANQLELSGTGINLNGGQGTGTPNLKMGGTTIIDSSRNLSNIGTANFTGNVTIDQGTSGDATLTLRSDTDNNDEGDHPQIRFQQDGDAVNYRFGIGTSASDVSTANNDLCITAEGSASSQLYMVTSAGVQHKFWHAGNDGSGSGLDADNLDSYSWSATGKTVGANNYNVIASNGAGLRFWNGSDSYRIYMASSGTSGAGRVSGETTSDYNMYFRMTGGTNRGFVFQSGTANKGGIDASGNARFTGNVTAYASDERLKENIKPIENPLEKLSKIRGVTYDWKDNIKNFDPKCKTETGVIAQEIEAVIPDAISPAPFNAEYKTVEKDKIIALLIEAVKELKAEVDELKAAK